MSEQELPDIKARQDFMGMNESDFRSLRSIQALIDQDLRKSLEKLYTQIRRTPQARAFFSSESHIAQAHRAQQAHWQRIAAADFGPDYVRKVQGIGAAHARIGLEPSLYIGGYGVILNHLLRAVIDDGLKRGGLLSRITGRQAGQVADSVSALSKAVLIEIDLTVSCYLDKIEQKRLELQAEQERRAEEDRYVIDVLGKALTALANGDLVCRIDKDRIPDRLDALRQHFNRTAEKLEQSLQKISSNASDVALNAEGIRQSAEYLSQRSEQQAATQEEMSAALLQITQGVGKTADETQKANHMADMVRTDAEQAGKVVQDAVDAMSRIETSSAEIAGIISIINEISVQTNILALNAGVEAARAGDVGRGFAVVANEVRALAQRSADAATEISSLIGLSGSNVKSGSVHVNDAGAALRRIVTQIHEINNTVASIATSTHGQSVSITELSNAMGELELTTQKNASAAEESASSARKLVETSDSLTQLVSEFNI